VNIANFAAASKKKLAAKPQLDDPHAQPDGMSPHNDPAEHEEAEAAKPGEEDGEEEQDPKKVAAQCAARVRAGKVDHQIVMLMKKFDAETDGYPAWAVDEPTWEQAESAVEPHAAGKGLPDPWLVVAATYQALGGKVDASKGAEQDDDMDEEDGEEGDEDEDAIPGDHAEPDGDEDEDGNEPAFPHSGAEE
jgi:hypothetical protein